MSGAIVSPELRAKIRGMVTPIALGLARIGLTPNALTLIGFFIACIAAVAAGAQAWLLAGFLVVFGGVFDLFDGAVARATGKVSKVGGFLDSTFDRWGEGVVYVGIAWGALAAGFDLGAVLASRGDGLRLHGQLHAREVREPGLHVRVRAWPPSASPRARCGSSSSPSAWSRPGCCRAPTRTWTRPAPWPIRPRRSPSRSPSG